MFTITTSPDIGASHAGRFASLDNSRSAAVVPVVGRGQSAGFVWVMLLHGNRIPFETADWELDQPMVGKRQLHFDSFGSTVFGRRHLGDLRHVFSNDDERRTAQLLAIEGVLYYQSLEGFLRRVAMTTGQPITELRVRFPAKHPEPFHFEESSHVIEDFGYSPEGGIRA